MVPINPVVLEKKLVLHISQKQIGPYLAEMFLARSLSSGVTFVPISHPTWLPGNIITSDWLTFLKIFFSDTTGGWN
jgi:hypothetical protein